MALKAVSKKQNWRAIKTTPIGSSVRFNRPNGMPKDEFERLAKQTTSGYRSKFGIHTKISPLNSGNALRVKVTGRDDTLATKGDGILAIADMPAPSLAGTSFDASVQVAKQAYVTGFLAGVLTADPTMLAEPKRLRSLAGSLLEGMPS